jgi:hypothetical protein
MDKDGYHGYDKEEQDPDELTMAYLSGVHDGKKQRTWVDLTDEEIARFDVDPVEAKALIQKLKEKNA